MMGSSKQADSITALLTLATDPAKVQAHLSKLQASAAAHQKVKEEAAEDRAHAQAEVENAKGYVAEVDAYAAKVKAELREERARLDKKIAAFEEASVVQNQGMKTAQERITAALAAHKEKAVAFQSVREAHARAVDEHTKAVAQVKSEHLQKENELVARSARLDRVEASLKDREDALSKAEVSLADRLKKLQELAVG